MLAQPDFTATRCVRYRYRYSACQRCAEACPHEAIKLGDEGITLLAERCRNCALCASACQTEALEADNLPRIPLLKAAAGKPRHSFACAPSAQPGDSVVPCLGGIDAAMLAYLSRRGVVIELRGRAHCGQCEHAPKGLGQLELNLEAYGQLRRSVGDETWAALEVTEAAGSVTDGTGHDGARRHLFRRLLGGQADTILQAEQAAHQPAIPLRAIRAAGPISTVRRELLQLLWPAPAGPHATFSLDRHAALPLADIQLDPALCTTCEACARACPTAALQIQESGVAWRMVYDAARCVGCEVCLETCQPRALSAAEHLDGQALRGGTTSRIELPKQRCERCDRFFISRAPARTCPICQGDEDDFAALFG